MTDPIDGPIVACTNAIEHYERLIDAEQSEIDKAESGIRTRRSKIAAYKECLDQWRFALQKLSG